MEQLFYGQVKHKTKTVTIVHAEDFRPFCVECIAELERAFYGVVHSEVVEVRPGAREPIQKRGRHVSWGAWFARRPYCTRAKLFQRWYWRHLLSSILRRPEKMKTFLLSIAAIACCTISVALSWTVLGLCGVGLAIAAAVSLE